MHMMRPHVYSSNVALSNNVEYHAIILDCRIESTLFLTPFAEDYSGTGIYTVDKVESNVFNSSTLV